MLPLSVRWSGVQPVPVEDPRPQVVLRIGLDPSPLDVRTPEAMRRLRESVPPEATTRVALMEAAARIVRRDPPVLVRGSVPDDLDRVLALVPDEVTPVVVTSGTLVYVPGAARQAFVDRIAAVSTGARGGAGRRPVRWISYERTGILHGVHATLPSAPHDPAFAIIALDGVAVALADPYGTRVHGLRPIPGRGADPST